MALNDMYYVGGGAGASYDAGQKRDLEQEQMRQQIQEYQLKNQQSQIMNPMLAQHQQGLNDTLQAQLPGVQGTSASRVAQGQVDTATVPDDIASKRSKVYSQLNDDQLKQLKNMGEKYSQVGAYLASVPSTTTPAGNTRALAAQKLIHHLGMDDDMPDLDHISPEQLPDILQKMGKSMAMGSGEFIQKRTMEQDKTQALIENAKTMADSRTDVATINAEARIRAAELATKRAKEHANIEQQITQITSDPAWKSNPAAVEQYTALMKSASILRNSAANGYQNAELLGQDSPGQRADSTINQVVGSKAASAETAPSVPAGMKLVGTSKGRPVYGDASNPNDKSKWRIGK